MSRRGAPSHHPRACGSSHGKVVVPDGLLVLELLCVWQNSPMEAKCGHGPMFGAADAEGGPATTMLMGRPPRGGGGGGLSHDFIEQR